LQGIGFKKFAGLGSSQAFRTNAEKIQLNVTLVPGLKESVAGQLKTRPGAFSTITVFGRWIVVYQSDVTDESETMMHFLNFRMDY